MSTPRKRRLTLAIALSLSMLVVIVTATLASSSVGTGGFNGLKDGGYLNLRFPDTNAPATFTQYDNNGVLISGQIQNITTANSCGANGVNPGTPDLAQVTASGGSLGAETSGTKFVGLGVKGKASNGTNCGRVEPGESLKVTLGTGLKLTNGDPAGSGLIVTAAELDIDGKGNALVRANLFKGTTQVGYALLSTQAASGSDSGPDSTSNDNFAFPINAAMPACTSPTPAAGQVCGSFAPFTSLALSTSTGPSGSPSFSLEGGRTADPRSTYSWDSSKLRTNTSDSVFKLQQSDGILFCGDTVQAGNGTDSFTRGANNKDGSTCVVVGYDYNNTVDTNTGVKTVELLWDTVSQPAATFTLTQTWLPEDSMVLGDGRPVPSKSTQVEWDPNIGFITAPACTSTSLPTGYGTLGAALGAADTTIQITLASGVTARSDAFNLQIGTEMISIPAQTPSVSGGVATYTGITRGAGNTTAGSYAIGANVMTTPFPILGTGGGAFVAKMCVSASSWVPTGITGTNGLPQVQVTETILTEGDQLSRH
jgi:hypothetical protein